MGGTLVDITSGGGPAAINQVEDIKKSEPVVPASSSTGSFISREASIPDSGKTQATPAVRRLAREHSIDLSLVVPSGPKGRVVKEDVLLYIQRKQHTVSPGTYNSPAASNAANSNIQQQQQYENSPAVQAAASIISSAGDERVPIRGVQRLMMKSMTESLQVITK